MTVNAVAPGYTSTEMLAAMPEKVLDAARAQIPELPAARAERYAGGLGLSDDSARQLAFRAELGDYFEAALAEIPELAARVAGREPASDLRGAGPFRQRTVRRSLGRVMLVGDASGYVDAITGEGIRVGLAQARAAIDCVDRDSVAAYEREWARRTRDFRVLTAGLVAVANSPLRSRIVPTAAALPRVFGAVVDRLAR